MTAQHNLSRKLENKANKLLLNYNKKKEKVSEKSKLPLTKYEFKLAMEEIDQFEQSFNTLLEKE